VDQLRESGRRGVNWVWGEGINEGIKVDYVPNV
jgi:hypothetical protein